MLEKSVRLWTAFLIPPPPAPFPACLHLHLNLRLQPFRPVHLLTLFHQPLRQRLENTQQLRVVRRSQTRHWIPSAHGGKARGPTPLVAPNGDVVERRRVGVDGRIDESDRLLARVDALLIDEGDDGAERRGGGRGSIDDCRASGESCQ